MVSRPVWSCELRWFLAQGGLSRGTAARSDAGSTLLLPLLLLAVDQTSFPRTAFTSARPRQTIVCFQRSTFYPYTPFSLLTLSPVARRAYPDLEGSCGRVPSNPEAECSSSPTKFLLTSLSSPIAPGEFILVWLLLMRTRQSLYRMYRPLVTDGRQRVTLRM